MGTRRKWPPDSEMWPKIINGELTQKEFLQWYAERVLTFCNDSQVEAAERLGISIAALRKAVFISTDNNSKLNGSKQPIPAKSRRKTK